MKKQTLLCYVVCVLFLFSLTACSGGSQSVTQLRSETADTTGTQAPSAGGTVSEQGTEATDETRDQDPSVGEPMEEIRFDSISDIKAFFSEERKNQTNSSADTIDKNIYQYATQSEAVEFSNSANTVYYPVADIDSGLCYRPDGPNGPYLEMIYIVDGVQYTFTYYFDSRSAVVYEDGPVFHDVQIGPYTTDLYRRDHPHADRTYLHGRITINGIHMVVFIQGEDHEEKLDFSVFDFIPLSAAGDDVTA